MYIDLLTKIKNAQAVQKKVLKTRFTRMDKAVADTLQRGGFIHKIEVKGRPSKRSMYIELRSDRRVEGMRFLSKPSVRRYVKHDEIRKVKGGYGMLVLSTPKGILSGDQAWREKTGGQILFEVW